MSVVAPIGYTLRFVAAKTHYIEVEAHIPKDAGTSFELCMAAWTPGSYMIREYARHVESVRATSGGAELSVQKTQKNRWRVTQPKGAAPGDVTVSYRVYGREMTVRTNWVEADFAIVNGAPTFLTLVENQIRPHDVRLELPAGW